MKKKAIPNKCIRIIGAALAGVLAVTSVSFVWQGETLNVKAAWDTLPGIEELRGEYITGMDTYNVLELVPDIGEARLGYYIGGQEPFSCLYDEESGKYIPWGDVLVGLKSEQERMDFMEQLGSEAEEALKTFAGTGEAPFYYETYSEVAAGTEGARSVSFGSYTRRGYFSYLSENAEEAPWNVVFTRLTDRDIPLSEINSGTGTPYYKAESGENYTYAQLRDMAAGEEADTLLYKLVNNAYLEYAGTAAEVWDTVKDISFTVSGNDENGSVIPAAVSDGDIQISMDDPAGYYTARFMLINNQPENQVGAGEYVYLPDGACTAYVGEGGNYTLTETPVGQAGETVTVPAKSIYFMGGIFNREVFRSQVLGLEAEECQEFQIQVEVVTPSMFNKAFYDTAGQQTEESIARGAEAVGQLDMVYVSCGTESAYRAEQNDLEYNPMERLAMHIYLEQIPCIFDLADFLAVENGVYAVADNDLTEANFSRLLHFLLESDRKLDGSETAIHSDYRKSSLLDVVKILNRTDAEGALETDSDRNMNFVYENIWFISTMESPFVRKGLLSDKEYKEAEIAGGLMPVLEEIRLENLYRQADTSFTGELLDTAVYDKTIWRYVVNYAKRRADIKKETLRVLEIQPATNKNKLTEYEISKWSGVEENKITIDTMPMNRFIGIIDDLNATYDIIYFGDSTDGMNTTTKNNKTTTIYKDTEMNGLLYSHVGDLVHIQARMSGLLDTDFVGNDPNAKWVNGSAATRYSGNDLTVEKYNALWEYLKASYPIIIDEGLLSVDSNKRTIVNPDRVDNSSYLYEFLSKTLENSERKNVFSTADLPKTAETSKNALFEFYANKPKLSLSCEEYPELIMTKNYYGGAEGVNNNVTEIEKSGDKYYLQYRFVISNSGAVSYDDGYVCRLYLDSNADGKFSGINEELTGLSITAGGKNIAADELKAGVEYTVTREVPANYYGCITWQLEVAQTNNTSIRTNRTGFTKLKQEGDIGTVIKILQIYCNDADKVINLQESIGTWNDTTRSYQQKDTDGDGKIRETYYFRDLADKVKEEYILDITTISLNTFKSGSLNGADIILDDYDMLILGFSDAKNGADFNDEDVIGSNSIQSFIESGKSVLFAHDMTSFSNISSTTVKNAETGKAFNAYTIGTQAATDYFWGYRMNRYIRGLVGLDAYGITAGNLDGNSSYTMLKRGNALTRTNGSLGILEPALQADGSYDYNTKDIAYKPKSGRAVTVPEVQGFTAYALHQRSYGSNYTYREGMKFENSNILTKKAVKVNEGQITNFPFHIGDNIDIAQTHSQYYTLDMNGDSDQDGQTDIVVWYNLSGGQFDKALGDIKNNYYIYNKANVTYTGMGHSASTLAGGVTQEEAKLFINTMIAAYNAGIRTPEVITKDGSGLAAEVIYNYYDEILGEDEGTVKLHFSVDDLNMAQGSKSIQLKLYAEDAINGSSELLTDDGEKINSSKKLRDVTEELKSSVYTANGIQVTDLYDLRTDTDYYVEVPVRFFRTDVNGYDSEFYIYAQTTIVKTTAGSSVTIKTPWGHSAMRYVNVELFDLD